MFGIYKNAVKQYETLTRSATIMTTICALFLTIGIASALWFYDVANDSGALPITMVWVLLIGSTMGYGIHQGITNVIEYNRKKQECIKKMHNEWAIGNGHKLL